MADVLADYRRLLSLMEEHGADLRLPHSRAMGEGLFELRCKGAEGIGRVSHHGRTANRDFAPLHHPPKKQTATLNLKCLTIVIPTQVGIPQNK